MKPHVEDAMNLFDFFNEQVERTSEDIDLTLHRDTRLYLANVLTERARMDRAAPEAHTLAELHAAAALAPPAQQARTYRELGDRALYAVGYFSESIERKIVSEDYYVDMGRAAYDRADFVFRRWFADAFGPVFRELAECFQDCARIYTRIRAIHEGDTLDALYREWLETGSEEVAQKLREVGLILPRTAGEV